MAVSVKGSKEYELKLVKHRPYVRVLALLFGSVAVAALVAATFQFGFEQGSRDLQTVAATLQETQSALADIEAKELAARRSLEQIKMGAQMDRSTVEDVRQEVIALKNQLAKLEEENVFYRNLMAPTSDKSGLTFGAVELLQTDDPREFRYKVVMQQLSTKHRLLNGTLKFSIMGKQAGLPMVYSLSDVSNDVQGASVKLRFKYFQNIEGTLTLPADFDAESIELVATQTSPKKVTVEKRFGWLVQSK